MGFIAWMAAGGALLLTMALSSALIQRLPVSTAAIYLGVGCLIGPWGFDLLRIDLNDSAPWIERLTEIAVVLSLFIGGLRLRLPLRHPAWRAAFRLASVVMIASIAGVAVCAWLLLDIGHSQDNDRLRYALSGEAGLNDGAAFPFVVLGLLLLGPISTSELASWAGLRLLWAVPAGLLLGYVLGRLIGSAAIALRTRSRDTAAPTDFLALALIALSYTAASAIDAWGFLAVFAAGIGLRHAEVLAVREDPHPQVAQTAPVHPPAESLVSPNTVSEQEMAEPAVAAGVLVAEVFSFGDTLERMLEVLLVGMVGVSLATHWDARALPLAVGLIVIVRPAAAWLLLAHSPTNRLQRLLCGWFGIRGIGSIYYLAFALTHGVAGTAGGELADMTISIVAISIVVHGLTSQPMMTWYDRQQSRRAP
jgi:NhaP-type Na+/H+ or K+/H+ antiporter